MIKASEFSDIFCQNRPFWWGRDSFGKLGHAQKSVNISLFSYLVVTLLACTLHGGGIFLILSLLPYSCTFKTSNPKTSLWNKVQKLFQILQKDSSIYIRSNLFITPFLKRISHCAGKAQPIWQVTTTYEMYRMILTVYNNTMGWNPFWRVIIIPMNLFSEIFLKFLKEIILNVWWIFPG